MTITPPRLDELELIPGDEVDRILGFRHAQRRWEALRAGLITRPIGQGRLRRWPRHEMQHIAAARIAGANDDDIRPLVDYLHDIRVAMKSMFCGEGE